jgi:NAD-dependent dihydropyrimidine dehydrogenase PreA subunit
MLRDVVIIEEERCDGCGLCVPACAEGALRIVNGKARLVADRLCDGMGACLGHCPRGAIRIERREAEEFDAAPVAATGHGARLHPAEVGRSHRAACPTINHGQPGECPGVRLNVWSGSPANGNGTAAHSRTAVRSGNGQASALTHWPVQLRLVPPTAPMLRGARLLVAADCVPFAYAEFHADLLAGRAVVVGCPKLDDRAEQIERLSAVIAQNELKEITVAHMQVPCCTGILQAVLEARRRAGSSVPVISVVIGIHGDILERREIVAAGADL